MTFSFDNLKVAMLPLVLADILDGRRARITSVSLEGAAAAWLGAVGLHEGEELTVLRRAALGGPLHVRCHSGGEFAVGRDVARQIEVVLVEGSAEP
jgi:ferrous iron transport protein A